MWNENRCRASCFARHSFWRACLALVCLVIYSGGARAVDVINLTMNYTVVQGTCTVSVGSDGVNGTLNFSNVSYDWKVSDSWPQINLKPFSVKLSNCSGASSANTQPGLTITGTTDTVTGNSINHSFMFVDNTSSTAKGFGFVIFNNQNSPVTQDAVADIGSTQHDSRKYINIPGFGKGSAVNVDTTIPLSAAVTCGETCHNSSKTGPNPNMQAGSLTGNVTFNFLYH
ncbi:type 1 fimbrial protein [Enterobacter cloacae]|nr:type 1 fimbrial protein [Enterobacter cloacae]